MPLGLVAQKRAQLCAHCLTACLLSTIASPPVSSFGCTVRPPCLPLFVDQIPGPSWAARALLQKRGRPRGPIRHRPLQHPYQERRRPLLLLEGALDSSGGDQIQGPCSPIPIPRSLPSLGPTYVPYLRPDAQVEHQGRTGEPSPADRLDPTRMPTRLTLGCTGGTVRTSPASRQ